MVHSPTPQVVLVVDDEPLIRMFAVDTLVDAGFEVIEACDAAEAVHMLGQHFEITVLFTDINMPGPFDGLELARRVHDLRPNIQLIITSGRERPPKGAIPKHGEFLPKPYKASAVTDLIRAATGH